jgi:hypothetical protein
MWPLLVQLSNMKVNMRSTFTTALCLATFGASVIFPAFANTDSDHASPLDLTAAIFLIISSRSNYDLDSDGDGVRNDEDAFPDDPAESVDTDGDGVGDNADQFPDDPAESVDTDGDGVGNNEDEDDDNDGVRDFADRFPLDIREFRDTDDDGIGDWADEDDDGDGVPDADDYYPRDRSRWDPPEAEIGSPPAFLSSDNHLFIRENSVFVNDFDVTSSATGSVRFTLSGDDASEFTVSSLGLLNFKSAKDYESDRINFSVTVEASNANGTSSLSILISLIDVPENNFGNCVFGECRFGN